jgi:4'-phosphopantetheinyl transferase EntD
MKVSLVVDPLLQRAVGQLSLPGILVDCRSILPGDEWALLEEEERSIASHVINVRRASGAARIVGRQLLTQLGYRECAIPKDLSGAPLWPAGIIGSFAHDDDVAVAAITHRRDISAVGIDVEPAELLPVEVHELIATPQEQSINYSDPYRGRLLFAAKEAVYKAISALDGIFLEYHDIEVDLAARQATLRDGRIIGLRYCASTHLIVLALVPRSDLASPICSKRPVVVGNRR